MTKILNFALKIKGAGREGVTCEVLRACHPPPKKNLERALAEYEMEVVRGAPPPTNNFRRTELTQTNYISLEK